jgi:hypothetical protein
LQIILQGTLRLRFFKKPRSVLEYHSISFLRDCTILNFTSNVCKNACFSQVSPTEYAIFKNFGQSDGLKHFFLNFHFSNYKDVWICFQVFDGYFNNLLKVIAYLYLFVCGLKIMDLIMENSDYFIFCLVAFFLQKCLTCTHVHSLLHKAFDNVFIIIILVVLRFEVRALTLLGRYSIAWAIHPVHLCFGYFSKRVLCFLSRPTFKWISY